MRQANKDGDDANDDNATRVDERMLSKSKPPLGNSQNMLNVDVDDLARHPIRPVAPVDSSWRHK